MAFTEAQQAALNRVRGTLGSQNEDEDEGVSRAQQQWEALQRVRARLGTDVQPRQEDVGFGEGMYNAVARGLSNLRSIPDAMRAEEFSTLADGRARQDAIDAERARTGEEAPWWERALLYRPSWAAPLETEQELRGLAADNAQAVARRAVEAQRNYPMTEAGARAIQEISEADGFIDGLGTVLMNPLDTASGIAQVAGEQIPTIVGAGAATLATRNPTAGLAAFAGSGYAQERFGQLVPEAEKEGYNLLSRQGAMDAVSDSEFMQDQAERGQVRGVIIGGVDLITAGLASRAPLTLRGLATQTGVQVAGGGGGEAAAQLATDGTINAGEVIIEALAEGVTAPADVLAFARNRNRPTPTGSDPNTEQVIAGAQEEAALQAQQAAEAEAAAQEEAVAVDAIKEARLDARETFISEQEFVRLRNQARTADILNRDTEIGQAFRQWQKDNDIVERDQKTQNQFLRDYVPQNDAEQARQEYLAALDEHAIYRQVDAQRTPETRAEIQQTKAELVTELQEARTSGDQEAVRLVEEKANNLLSPAEWRATKMEADGVLKTEAKTDAAADEKATVTPAETPTLTKRDTLRQYATEKLGENWEQDNPELSQLFSDGKGIYSRGKNKKSRFESMVDKLVAEQQQATPAENNAQTEATPQTEVLQDNTPDTNTETPLQTEENAEAPTPVAQMDAQAEAYAQDKLGPDWRNENPQLLELLRGKKYAGFQSTVDTIAARKTPAETGETATKGVEELFSQPMQGAKLSPNEQKVWDTINDAFQNNGQDEVIQVDGSWNTQAIAEKAGLKSRQAVQTALTRLKPKIAKAYGLDQATIKDTLAATRIKNVEAAPDINAPTSELDMADLAEGQGFNTKASVNQGAAEGVDADDVAYTQARSQEPDDYANKRQEIADRQRQQDNVAMVRQFGQLAVQAWKNIATNNAVAIKKLSKQDLMEWVSIVAEHNAGMIDDAQLAADQREIEMRYDAQPALENANATATVEGTATAVEAGPAEGTDTGPTQSAESGNPAEQVGTADTGIVGQEQRRPTVVTKKRKKIDPQKAKTENPRFGVRPDANATASREAFNELVNELTGAEENVRIHIFDNEQQALEAVENGDVPSTDVDELMAVQPYGWVTTDDAGVPHAHFILDRIPAGGERAAFMHEVGSHIGIDSVLDTATSSEIARQIADWAGANDGSLESRIALRTIQRLDLAAMRGGVSDGVVISEAIAYFLEEATLEGVTPSSKGALGEFVARIYDAFVAALRKLGINKSDTLTAQDIVDLAYGAARVELVEGSLDPTTDTRAFTEPSMGVRAQQNQSDAKFGLSRDWTKQNLGETATKFFDDASFIARNAVDSTKFLHQFIRENAKTMPSAGRWYKGMLEAEKTRNDIRRSVEDIATQARDLSANRLDAVNEFIGKSTFYQKWGYDPQWQGKTVKVDPILKAAFDRLDSKEQALVKAIFQHGENMRQRKQNIAKQLGVQGKFFTDASLEGPYAPLKRFGNFAAELKSQDLLDAEADVAATPNKINRDRAAKLRSDPAHYVISFFDTLGAARQFTDANNKNFAFTEASERAPDFNDDRISNPEVFEKVLGSLKANQNAAIDPAAKTAFADMVKKLYFQSLDERSARLSGARRMNRAGYEKNMIRSFLSHARAEAALVANMEHGAEINTAFADAANEAKTNRAKLQGVYNMIAKHYKDTLAGKETPIQDRIAAMNSVYMLTTSVGYHLTNATQPVMVTIPRLAGDFNNYSGAWGALIRGYKVSLKAAKMGKNFEADIDVSKAPPRYRKLLEDLQLRQLLDVGMEEDLSAFDRFNTGYEPLNQLTDKLGKVVHKLYQVARFVEAHNRISAAVAAFDMASNNRAALAKMNMTPEEYATTVVEDTQGNFSRFDAPLLVKSLPKLTTQYRKYQLMMGWAYGNAFDAAFLDKTISPEEKAMGKRTLGYMLAHAGMFAGATGIPLVTTIAPYVLAFIEDAEEPQDLERWIRENVEDERLADVLTRGLPAFFGIDMSTKLSQAKIFHPFPYVDFEASEDGVRDVFFNAMAGPAGTTALNFGRAASYFEQGDLLKGIEYSVPKGLRTMIESYRLATEGFTVRNGDVIVDPREIDISSLLLNAVGIPATDINQIRWTRGQQYELEQYISGESSRIRREYIRARDDNDRARQTELRQDWRDLQDAKDRVRPFFGGSPRELSRQSVSDLLRAPYQQDRRERRNQRRFQ